MSVEKEHEISETIISVNFVSTFPHKVWISDWSKDQSYPKGFRYKIFSIRLAEEDMFRVVVVFEEPGGYKTEMERLKVSTSAVERTCSIFVQGLAEDYRVDFEEQDLSDVTSAQEFEKRATALGWYEWQQ